MSIIFFDTETTGLPLNYDAPCTDVDNWPRLVQLAWVMDADDGPSISAGNCLIRPEGFEIHERASLVHGITTERALASGVNIKEALGIFLRCVKASSLIVGHSVAFDISVVGAECVRVGAPYEWGKPSYCTMLRAIDHCAIPSPYGLKWPKLQELHSKLFGCEFDNAHNAMSDVTAAAKCYWEMRRLGL